MSVPLFQFSYIARSSFCPLVPLRKLAARVEQIRVFQSPLGIIMRPRKVRLGYKTDTCHRRPSAMPRRHGKFEGTSNFGCS